MAYSYILLQGDGSTTVFSVPFQYLDKSHVTVKVGGVETAFTWLTDSTISVTPATSSVIEIRRTTPKDEPPVDFSDGSVLKESELDLLALFSLYCVQESQDAAELAIAQSSLGIALGRIYQGVRTSPPTIRTDLTPIQVGDMYFDSDELTLKVYTGILWQAAGATVPGILNKPATPVIATAGQTSVPVPGGYDPAGITVFLNGTEVLSPDVDTSSGTNVVFSSALSAGDEVSWLAFGVFQVADAATKAELASIGGSALIGHRGSETGAVLQPLSKILGETVSILRFGADPTGVADSSAAIQAAITAAGPKGTVKYPKGAYKIAASINLEVEQTHDADGAVLFVTSGVTAFTRTTDGYPGRIRFHKMAMVGAGIGTGTGVSITNNTPFVNFTGCYFTGFGEGVRLSGSYASSLRDSYFVGNSFGAVLLNECHMSSLDSCLFDNNQYAGLAINGDGARGNLGTISTHNITVNACGFQHSEFGLWAENCLELHVINPYYEGNTKGDLRLGVADGGAYARACYNFTVDGYQSSSACALGKNIIMEHAVNGNLRGLAFNAGTSSSANVLSADGFSDLIQIDYHRVQHSSIGAAFSLPAARIVVSHNGRRSIPWNLKGLNIGTLGAEEGQIYGGLTGGGRPTLTFSSLGSSQDLTVKVQEIERHEDSSGTLRASIDHVNSRFETGYIFRPMVDNTTALGESSRRWSVVWAGTGTISTSDERAKQDIESIPQAWLDAWAEVEWVRFKFKDAVVSKGDGARWHVGLIAQRVKAAFEARGIDPFAIGLLCYDEWPEQTDVDGNTTPAGDLYGIRYEEALALECAYLRSRLPN